MKIAFIAPIKEPVPPIKYGPIHYNLDKLATKLTEMGHDVTMYCAGASGESSYKKVAITDKAYSDNEYPLDLISDMSKRSKEIAYADIMKSNFDVINNQTGYVFLKRYKDALGNKMLTTITWTLEDPEFRDKYLNIEDSYLVVLSEFQAKYLKDAQSKVYVIYTGIDTKDFSLNLSPKDYICFLGRIDPDKGIEDAIKAALQAKQKIIIGARIDLKYQEYFENVIKPYIDNENVIYLGEIAMQQKVDLLSNAKAMLFPAYVNDALSNSVLECLACGTPVLAYNAGPINEVIENGKTGFVCKDVEDMAKKIAEIDSLDRKACREIIEAKFSIDAMAKNYLQAFEEIVSKNN